LVGHHGNPSRHGSSSYRPVGGPVSWPGRDPRDDLLGSPLLEVTRLGPFRAMRWGDVSVRLGEAPEPRTPPTSDGDAMSETSPSSTPSSPVEPVAAAERPSHGRSVAAVICVVLAGLLTMPAAVAYWGQRTLNDTERYVATVDPLVASPEVQDVIATRVTEASEKQVDIEAILNSVFAGVITDRPRLEQLVGPLAAAINGLIDREVREFIASDEFADLWVRINTRAQQALHRVLTGEGSGAVTVQGNQVVLDVDEVIEGATR